MPSSYIIAKFYQPTLFRLLHHMTLKAPQHSQLPTSCLRCCVSSLGWRQPSDMSSKSIVMDVHGKKVWYNSSESHQYLLELSTSPECRLLTDVTAVPHPSSWHKWLVKAGWEGGTSSVSHLNELCFSLYTISTKHYPACWLSTQHLPHDLIVFRLCDSLVSWMDCFVLIYWKCCTLDPERTGPLFP